ncbi:MAG: glycogen debranching protein [Chloroflexi bacterium]|nr:glycogen debranching protein [Chloroflexota bacterium]
MMHDRLRDAALLVLRNNDLGDWTKPAPRLYPHQWSWDSAFIAIGLAHVDVDRALRELESLFAAQWSDGRVPHIVFNPEATGYFPGPERWASEISPHAPHGLRTSGLIQPPVHAIALQRLNQVARQLASQAFVERIARLYGKMLRWHRYLAEARDPDERGLLLIYHPWESGTDNSPRWDSTLARIEVGDLEPYTRHDVKHVSDPSERPTQAEYDRYLWLVELLKRAAYSDSEVQQNYPFLVRDVLMSAIFAAACHALEDVGTAVGRTAGELNELRVWRDRFASGVQHAFEHKLQLALDFDERTESAVRVETCAGLAPLLLPQLDSELLRTLVQRLQGDGFAGAADFAHAVVPSTAPGSVGFDRRRYWRGPAWPIANWLFWSGLRRHGQSEAAERLRAANLELLSRPDSRFGEYFEPYTAEPLGSLDQSWTAAVTLDWLATAVA